MKKAIIAALVLVVLVFGAVLARQASAPKEVAAPAPQNDTSQNQATEENANVNQTTPAEISKVDITNSAFTPATVTVKKGTTVTWTNKDTIKHTVTPDEETADFKGSELLAQEATYSWTFDKAGTYTYYCQPHPDMKGTVVVTE